MVGLEDSSFAERHGEFSDGKHDERVEWDMLNPLREGEALAVSFNMV